MNLTFQPSTLHTVQCSQPCIWHVQVLSNAQQRQLYDLSLNSGSRTVRSAAEQGTRYTALSPWRESLPSQCIVLHCCNMPSCCSQGAQAPGRDDEWVPGDGWFAWATKPQSTPINPNQIDKLRAELRTEFNAAVRHAYLGPR